ncbi:MAG: VCBS repeat-containing protein [Nitrospina sp.]|nr:MAG: VCBS repeat-containing protein [Nitrospina sp.]
MDTAIASLGTLPSLVANDFDGNANSDLLVYNTSTGQTIVVSLDNATPTSANSVVTEDPATGWVVKATGDFNGDCNLNLLLYNTLDGSVRVILLDGSTVLSETTVLQLPAATNFEIRGTGDFDGDGDSDLVIFNPATGLIGILFLENASLVSGEGVIQLDVDNNWDLINTGDFDGDGKFDLLAYQTDTGIVAEILLDGSTVLSFTGLIALDSLAGWGVQDTADFNNDGCWDLLTHNTTDGWLNGHCHSGWHNTNPHRSVPGRPRARLELDQCWRLRRGRQQRFLDAQYHNKYRGLGATAKQQRLVCGGFDQPQLRSRFHLAL